MMGYHYTDHHQQSRIHQGKVYAGHTPEIFSLFCHHMVAATWFMSLLMIFEAKQKI
jgi:hypothetical protein